MSTCEPDLEAVILAKVYRILLAAAEKKRRAAAAQEAEAEPAEVIPVPVTADVKEAEG